MPRAMTPAKKIRCYLFLVGTREGLRASQSARQPRHELIDYHDHFGQFLPKSPSEWAMAGMCRVISIQASTMWLLAVLGSDAVLLQINHQSGASLTGPPPCPVCCWLLQKDSDGRIPCASGSHPWQLGLD